MKLFSSQKFDKIYVWWYWNAWSPKNWWDFIRCHTFTRYHIVDCRSKANGYTFGWVDTDRRILHACFNLLKEYVEKEKPFEVIDWDWDEHYKEVGNEIKALYNWWTVERPKDVKTHGYAADELDAADDEMLSRLMKIRGYLWT